MNIKDIESESFDAWIEGLGKDGVNATISVTEELAELAKKEAIIELQKLKRKGVLPRKRKFHMYQDVVIVSSRRYKRMEVGGGKETGTLWHIVNDGTYRTNATHFMDNVVNRIDAVAEAAWQKAGRKLE